MVSVSVDVYWVWWEKELWSACSTGWEHLHTRSQFILSDRGANRARLFLSAVSRNLKKKKKKSMRPISQLSTSPLFSQSEFTTSFGVKTPKLSTIKPKCLSVNCEGCLGIIRREEDKLLRAFSVENRDGGCVSPYPTKKANHLFYHSNKPSAKQLQEVGSKKIYIWWNCRQLEGWVTRVQSSNCFILKGHLAKMLETPALYLSLLYLLKCVHLDRQLLTLRH